MVLVILFGANMHGAFRQVDKPQKIVFEGPRGLVDPGKTT